MQPKVLRNQPPALLDIKPPTAALLALTAGVEQNAASHAGPSLWAQMSCFNISIDRGAGHGRSDLDGDECL
jgi:hypothetical protein